MNAATLKPILREQIDKAAMVFTDEASYYGGLRADFPAGHFTVQHKYRRIRPGRRDRQRVRELFFDPKARHQRRLSACEPDAPEAVRRRVRLPLQQPHRIGRRRFRAYREGCQGCGRQTAHLPKNSSATRSRSDLAARLIGGATAPLPLRPILASCLSGSMNRRSLNDLLDGALESLPRVRMEFDPLFFGRGWLRSLRSRHSAKYVVGSEQLETGGLGPPGSAPRDHLASRHRTMTPYLRPLAGTFNRARGSAPKRI